MNKIDPFAVFLHFVFIFIYLLLFIVMAVKVWISFVVGTDVPMYKKPTLPTESTTATTTTIATTISEETGFSTEVIEFDAEYYED